VNVRMPRPEKLLQRPVPGISRAVSHC
jgi:hypothetical protein